MKSCIENGCQTTIRQKRFNHYFIHKLKRDGIRIYIYIYISMNNSTYIVDDMTICYEIQL